MVVFLLVLSGVKFPPRGFERAQNLNQLLGSDATGRQHHGGFDVVVVHQGPARQRGQERGAHNCVGPSRAFAVPTMVSMAVHDFAPTTSAALF